MIRLAVQSKGRLNEESLRLLKDAGINVDDSKRKFLGKASDFPLELLYLRDDDIPGVVADGSADIGIVGYNEIAETQADVEVIRRLGFGKCRLSLAIPKGVEYPGLEWFEGKSIATSYPSILRRFLSSNLDMVPQKNTPVLDSILFRFDAIQESRGKKYILMNIPSERLSEAMALLPSMRSPTVMPLALEGWCSVHSVVDDSSLWATVESLKKTGAEGILILNVDKVID